MADMEAWFQALDYRDQAAWLLAWEAGRVDPELVATLPPDQRSLAIEKWVHVVGTTVAGHADGFIAFHPDLDAFLRDEYDARRVDE